MDMKLQIKVLSSVLITLLLISCNSKQTEMENIIFLHHSTGQRIWIGETNRYIFRLTKRNDVQNYFKNWNKKHKSNYVITERAFPAATPYGWKNDPYDYYNIWVKNAGDKPYMNEPTLEILTREYDVIIYKHCYPVSNIMEDTGNPDINSEERRIENYKLQYLALKSKMQEFPDNKFIIWTPAVQVQNNLTLEEAQRTQSFYRWMKEEWDDKGDNVYIWDFYQYETDGGLYLKDEYSTTTTDSHPNKKFAGRIAPLFAQFIIDVIEGKVD